MSPVVICTGLACGMLLTTTGLALWDNYRETPGLARAGQIVSWLASATLLIGFILNWASGANPTNHLILMAALAAPLIHHTPSSWSQAISTLPALILSSIALFWAPGSNEIAPVIGLMIALCGGVGAQALGGAMAELATQTQPARWPTLATYSLLTLLTGATTLMNLWQYGTVWSGSVVEKQLTSVWMVWSAVQITNHQSRRLRTGLIIVAALLLITLAAGYRMP